MENKSKLSFKLWLLGLALFALNSAKAQEPYVGYGTNFTDQLAYCIRMLPTNQAHPAPGSYGAVYGPEGLFYTNASCGNMSPSRVMWSYLNQRNVGGIPNAVTFNFNVDGNYINIESLGGTRLFVDADGVPIPRAQRQAIFNELVRISQREVVYGGVDTLRTVVDLNEMRILSAEMRQANAQLNLRSRFGASFRRFFGGSTARGVGATLLVGGTLGWAQEAIANPLEPGESLMDAYRRIFTATNFVEGVGNSFDGMIGGGQVGSGEDAILFDTAREVQIVIDFATNLDRINTTIAELEAIQECRNQNGGLAEEICPNTELNDPVTGATLAELYALQVQIMDGTHFTTNNFRRIWQDRAINYMLQNFPEHFRQLQRREITIMNADGTITSEN